MNEFDWYREHKTGLEFKAVYEDANEMMRSTNLDNFEMIGLINGEEVIKIESTIDIEDTIVSMFLLLRHKNRFIVTSYGEMPQVKTCIGVNIKDEERYGGGTYKHLTIYWDDGTLWRGALDSRDKPQLLGKDDMWIWEAKQRISELLAGCRTKFEVDFIDGSKFVGYWKPKEKGHHKSGGYKVKMTLKSGKRMAAEGYFTSTKELPTVEAYMKNAARIKGDEIQSIDSCIRIGKKEDEWHGVYNLPQDREDDSGEELKELREADNG